MERNGTVKNGQNDAMPTASQPKKTPCFLCLPGAILRQSGLAVIAVATMLTTSIKQAGAWFTIDENGNVIIGPTPPAPVPVQPAAVPPPFWRR